jgi:2-dehydro-3-deoxyphosphogluconate aldolase/(4S)-4-hydroxy-2-oxoglutarate aldolase
LPLFYHNSPEISLKITSALYEAGIRMIEYTARGVNALENFKVLKKESERNFKDLQIGIGTIKNEDQAKTFIEAGADFVVSPTINNKVGKICHAGGVFWIPGCMTATEISKAEEAGAAIVKIFPGNLLGPPYIKAIRELFPDLKFMPTGGVELDQDNLNAWFKSGVVAVGMGSKLISTDMVESQNFDALKSKTEKVLQMTNNITLVP